MICALSAHAAQAGSHFWPSDRSPRSPFSSRSLRPGCPASRGGNRSTRRAHGRPVAGFGTRAREPFHLRITWSQLADFHDDLVLQ